MSNRNDGCFISMMGRKGSFMVNSKLLYDKRNALDSWRDFPEVLVNLLQAIYHSSGDYGVDEAIKYLKENDAVKNEHKGNAKMTYLRWVDRLFRSLYPMFSFEDVWFEESDDLECLLLRAERYLIDLSDDYEVVKNSNRTEQGFYDDEDLVSLDQRLNFYFCTLHWYQGKYDLFEARLKSILEATKRNIFYMLSHEDAAELWELDFAGMDGFYSLEFYYWQPLVWVYHEGGGITFSQNLIEAFEEYINYLYGLKIGDINIKVCEEVILKAEDDLQWLFECELDEQENEDDFKKSTLYYDACRRKLMESKERVKTLKRSLDPHATFNESEDDFEEEKDWGEIWEDTCRVLKDDLGMISFDTWIEPLSIHHVDSRNGILYLMWPNHERLLEYLEDNYLGQIEIAVKMFAQDIERVVVFPCDPKMQNQHYHRIWSEFTNSLRSLMQSPTLPVVVFCESGEGETESYIADPGRTQVVEGVAYDPKTGEPAEKIIAIYVNPLKKVENDFFVPEEDIPC